MWKSIDEAAALKHCSTRHIYRLIKGNKIQSEQTEQGMMVWIEETTSPTPDPFLAGGVTVPETPPHKITEAVLVKAEGMLISIGAAVNIAQVETDVEAQYSLSRAIQGYYKKRLRAMFNIPAHGSISHLTGHPQIRPALEHIITRDERSDKLTLRSAKGLSVAVPRTGEMVPVTDFLKALYPRENVTAISCYLALKTRCLKGDVLKEDESKCELADLPSEASVVRYLKKWRAEYMAVRRGKTRKHEWAAKNEPYVSRDVTEYLPGELWMGDHTELDFMVINEDGKLDRRWISTFIDVRTRLMVGYHLSWQPNSETVALAFRSGVLGSKLRAFTGDEYQPVQITNIPVEVYIDNGKDYKSNYTKRVFGKIEFADDARKCVQRFTKLHYVLPYHGQSKAQQERWYGTIQKMLVHLPGYKGNKYQNKPDSLAKDIKQGAILHVEEFDSVVGLAINAYNNRIHSALAGQSPLQHYLTNYTHSRTISMRVLDFLMKKAANRVINRCQIKLNGIEYYSEALQEFNGKHADVYYDPNDMGYVSIYADGEFAAVACNKDVIGAGERGWQKILRDRARTEKSMQEQLKEFKQGIPDHDARMMLLEGQLLNTTAVPAELLNLKKTNVVITTGIEDQANESHEEVAKEMANVERDEARKRRNSGKSWTMDDVANVS